MLSVNSQKVYKLTKGKITIVSLKTLLGLTLKTKLTSTVNNANPINNPINPINKIHKKGTL